MKTPIFKCHSVFLPIFAIVFINGRNLAVGENLSCYQCLKTEDVECSQQDLLPCHPKFDRCVTHITKNENEGFKLKRECGLAPCDFGDAMANTGLGWNCDRSKKEFTCLSCCRESGCNKNSATTANCSCFLILIACAIIAILNIFERYQPPYLPEN